MAEKVAQNTMSAEGIEAYWASVSAPLHRLLKLMDSREAWVVEPDAEFLGLLDELVSRLEDSAFIELIQRGENPSLLAEVFARLNTSRFMRLIGIFDRLQPGIINRFLYAISQLGGGAEVFSTLFQERLLVVHRSELLGQILSMQRCQRVAQTIQIIRELAE